MSYWSFDQRTSEDDVIHAGRKGTKRGKNIFYGDAPSKNKNQIKNNKKKVFDDILNSVGSIKLKDLK